MSAGCPKKCIDRRVLLCYPDTTTDIAMIIVATIDVAMSVEDNETGDWEEVFHEQHQQRHHTRVQ